MLKIFQLILYGSLFADRNFLSLANYPLFQPKLWFEQQWFQFLWFMDNFVENHFDYAAEKRKKNRGDLGSSKGKSPAASVFISNISINYSEVKNEACCCLDKLML